MRGWRETFLQVGRRIRQKRGGSTLEYVVILAAALVLGMVLYTTLTADETKSVITQKVQQAINGEVTGVGNGGSATPSTQQQPSSSPQHHPPQNPSQASPKKQEEPDWFVQGLSNLKDRASSKLNQLKNRLKKGAGELKDTLSKTYQDLQHGKVGKAIQDLYNGMAENDALALLPGTKSIYEWREFTKSLDRWDPHHNKTVNIPGVGKVKVRDLLAGISDWTYNPFRAMDILVNGEDPLTHEKMSGVDRWLYIADLFPEGGAVKQAGKEVVEEGAEQGIKHYDEIKSFIKECFDSGCGHKIENGLDAAKQKRREELLSNINLEEFDEKKLRNKKSSGDMLREELEKVDFKESDIGLIYDKLKREKLDDETADTTNIKSVIGEYLAEKAVKRKFGDKYEILPTKINNSDNGIDHIFVARNEKGEIDHIIVAESKFNTSKLGKNIQDCDGCNQMDEAWIRMNAEKMADSDDPNVQEAGEMLLAALNGKSYKGQRLSKGMIDTRLYRVKPKNPKKPRDEWVGVWERDPQNTGLKSSKVPDNWP